MIGEHRVFETFEPKGEIAVAQRPDKMLKIVCYPKSGGDDIVIVLQKDKAFDFAMEILQHVYRLGEP